MKFRRAIAGLLLIPIVCFIVPFVHLYLPDRSVPPGTAVESYTAYLDKRIPGLMKRYEIPGASLALVKDGRIVWKQAYGYADRESGSKLSTDTLMRVQSISKSVTAWGIMKLAEEGKLNLDHDVGRYLKNWRFPESTFPADRVTIRQLLSHTAGMPLGDVLTIYSPTDRVPSLEESLTASAIPVKDPGSGFFYSNVGYNLLELLIEEVTGRDFAQYMSSEVLSPLGMKKSTFVWSEDIKPPLPKGYTLNGKTVPVYVYPEKASGGLLATAEDIAAFAVAGMPLFSNQDVLTPSGIKNLYAPQAEKLGIYSLVFDAYGSGYYLERFSSGQRAVSHGGQGTGWMSHFQAVPETGDAIVILTNSQRSWPFIAGLLNNWAQWRGFSLPGMTRLLLGECALWALVGLLAVITLYLTANTVVSVANGSRRFALPRFNRASLPRLMQSGLSLAMLAGLWWCVCQKYLFLSSVFPTVSGWLGVCTAVLAGVLLLCSFFVPAVIIEK